VKAKLEVLVGYEVEPPPETRKLVNLLSTNGEDLKEIF